MVKKDNSSKMTHLTPKEWQELELTGIVIKGDRIIRKLSHAQRQQRHHRNGKQDGN